MTATLLALAATSAAPAAAGASSLLSGYGGPGQGNQAILGSALLGGPSGGGGTSGPAGAGSVEAGSGSAAGIPNGESAAPPALGKTTTRGKARRGDASKRPRHAAAATPPGLGSPTYARTASLARGLSTPALGLSGADVVYILLAAAALALTGFATGRMAREAR